MVMITDKKGIERFSLSTRLFKVTERIQEKIYKEDSMVLGILWGGVGGGKSVKAQHIGYVINKNKKLDINKVAFDKDEFIEAVLNSRKEVVIGDEGIALFFSRGSMSREGRLMAELMAQCRQKNLCIIICVPELLSIDYLILQSANFVGYVWESKKEINDKPVTIKGNLALYPAIVGDDYKMKIVHYLRTKKRNPHAKIFRPTPYLTQPGNPIGKTFKKVWYPVGEEAYRKKKESILEKYRRKEIEKEIKKKGKVDKDLVFKQFGRGLTTKEVAAYWGVSPRCIRLWKKKYKKEMKKE